MFSPVYIESNRNDGWNLNQHSVHIDQIVTERQLHGEKGLPMRVEVSFKPMINTF